MMIYIYILLLFSLGYLTFNFFDRKLNIGIKVGASLPLGLGYTTILMFVHSVLGLKYSNISLLTIVGITILILIWLTIKYNKGFVTDFNAIKDLIKSFRISKISLAWLLCFAILSYVVYGMILKQLYWPTNNLDSVNGYNYMAIVSAVEGTFNNSIFSKINPSANIRTTYPPLIAGSFSIAYMSGLEMCKIISTIFLVSILLTFYSFIKEYSTHLCAIFFTLMLFVVPEYVAYFAFSNTNNPHALYVLIGVVLMIMWLKNGRVGTFVLGSIFMALNTWNRSDGIAFLGAVGIVLLIDAIVTKKWKNVILYGILTPIPFLSWQLFVSKVLQVDFSSNAVIKKLFWDPEKISQMLPLIKKTALSTQYFGITFYTFLIVLGISIILNIRNKTLNDHKNLLIVIFCAFFFYAFLYYQMPFSTHGFPFSMTEMLGYSFKRGMFPFLPLVIFYMATNRYSQWLFKNYLA